MKKAFRIESTSRDATDAAERATAFGVAKDQDWTAESTTWTFDDNSTLTICGQVVTAKDWDDEV